MTVSVWFMVFCRAICPCPADGTRRSSPTVFSITLPIPEALWQTVRRYSRPGAAILVIDLLRPVDENTAELIIDTYVPDAPPILHQDMLLSLRAAYTLEEISAQLLQANLNEDLTLQMASPFQFAVFGYLNRGCEVAGQDDCQA